MPKYRVKETSFINNKLAAEGDVVDYDGKPGPNLEPIDSAAQDAVEEASKELGVKNISVTDLTRQKVAAIGGEPDATDAAQAASTASAAAAAALDGKAVTVDGKPVEAPGAGAKPVAKKADKKADSAQDLV